MTADPLPGWNCSYRPEKCSSTKRESGRRLYACSARIPSLCAAAGADRRARKEREANRDQKVAQRLADKGGVVRRAPYKLARLVSERAISRTASRQLSSSPPAAGRRFTGSPGNRRRVGMLCSDSIGSTSCCPTNRRPPSCDAHISAFSSSIYFGASQDALSCCVPVAVSVRSPARVRHAGRSFFSSSLT